MRRLRLLAIIGGVMVMMFALTLGSASADYEGGNEEDGINEAADTGAKRPIGDNVIDGEASDDAGDQFTSGPASDPIQNNPMCPLNDGWDHED